MAFPAVLWPNGHESEGCEDRKGNRGDAQAVPDDHPQGVDRNCPTSLSREGEVSAMRWIRPGGRNPLHRPPVRSLAPQTL